MICELWTKFPKDKTLFNVTFVSEASWQVSDDSYCQNVACAIWFGEKWQEKTQALSFWTVTRLYINLHLFGSKSMVVMGVMRTDSRGKRCMLRLCLF